MQNEFLRNLRETKKEYEEKIAKLREMQIMEPDGRLVVKKKKIFDKNHNMVKVVNNFYQKIEKKLKYLGKNDFELVKALAQKEYTDKKMAILIRELKHIEILIELESNEKNDIYGNLSEERQALVQPLELSDEEFGRQWLKSKTKHTNPLDKTNIHVADNGEETRSKNEELKVNELYRDKIVYAYEAATKVGNVIRYPDLTILNKHTRKEYIFEDFGMLDNEKYYNSMQKKLSDYLEAGYIFGQNFFCIFETNDYLTSDKMFKNLVKSIFDCQTEIDKFR